MHEDDFVKTVDGQAAAVDEKPTAPQGDENGVPESVDVISPPAIALDPPSPPLDQPSALPVAQVPEVASLEERAQTDLEPSAAEPQDKAAAVLGSILEAMQQLQASFDDKIKYDAGREAVIDRLHAEIQEYRADLVLKLLKPFALDLINLYDDAGKMVVSYRGKVEGSPVAEKLLSLLEGFQSDIEDVLDRNGFSSFTAPESEFDPKRQRAVQRTSTDDPALDRTISERIRKGFVYGDKVIRPELVAVAVCDSKRTN